MFENITHYSYYVHAFKSTDFYFRLYHYLTKIINNLEVGQQILVN
jgi:hypothetical protein